MLIFVLIAVIVYTYILRKKFLKDQKEYMYYRDIPSRDSPAFVGKIVKGHTDGNDIIATILDLNYRGYIRIETEKIKSKEKRVLYLEKSVKTTELQEHEMFLINRIFKNNNRIIFENYIKSSKFKQDFKAFDKMLDRRIERKKVYKDSIFRNLNKILLLLSYFIFGINIFYSIILPITFGVNSIEKFDTKILVIINLTISIIVYLLVSYKYISYIEKSTNARENINLNITYIILSIVLGCFIVFYNNNLFSVLYAEITLYKVIINFIISIIIVMYMFNIIQHTEKEEYLYYLFIIISAFAIVFNMKLTMGVSIIFFINYIFFKSQKYSDFKQDDYIWKWIAFKKYLEDYSMLSEQDTNAIMVWEEYFVYAIALGVNRKIIKKYAKLNNVALINDIYLKKVYVEYFE